MIVGPHGESAPTRVPAHALSVPRALHISNVHNYQPVLLEIPALMLGACSQLEPIPVLVEAREQPTMSGSRALDIVDSIMRHQHRHERRAMAHRKPHAADALPRWIPD